PYTGGCRTRHRNHTTSPSRTSQGCAREMERRHTQLAAERRVAFVRNSMSDREYRELDRVVGTHPDCTQCPGAVVDGAHTTGSVPSLLDRSQRLHHTIREKVAFPYVPRHQIRSESLCRERSLCIWAFCDHPPELYAVAILQKIGSSRR